MIAGFTANQTQICGAGQVQFTDQSTGNPTSWSWSFPGGDPATSTLQNPVVTYSTPGQYNVELTVSSGTTNNTITKQNYIQVDASPAVFAGANGETCENEPFTVTDASSQNTMMVSWQIVTGAGTIQDPLTLSPTYIPAPQDAGTTVTLKLTGTGNGSCNAVIAESTVDIAVLHQPEVTLAPIGTVCYEVGVYPLSGGYPEGGTYSGPGVSNNILYTFDAGVGTHVITYTWADGETGCSNSAESTVEIELCSGVPESEQTSFNIYPNPSKGEFTIELKTPGNYLVTITNMAGAVVFEKKISATTNIQLDNLENGIYNAAINDGKSTVTRKLTIKK